MNILDPRLTYLEMDRRLRSAEQRRRVRLARAVVRSAKTAASSGLGG